jgi:hypothetical protein
MPKAIFEGESDDQILINILNMVNSALAGSSKAKTVEELQAIINNVNVVLAEVKNLIKNL